MKNEIGNLIDEWERISRRMFCDAALAKTNKSETLVTEEAAIIGGALIYFNCAQEIKSALASVLPHALDTQQECRK